MSVASESVEAADRMPAQPGRRGRARRDWIVFAALMAVAWLLPIWLGGFVLYLGCIVAFHAIAALGLQVMVGLAGQLSLGHAAFLGIGAYTTVLLEKSFGLSFPVAALGAVLASALAGLLMAQLVRLSGIYFKIATFGFGIIVHQIISNWVSLTGGTAGIKGVPPIGFLGWTATSRLDLFITQMVALTIVYALLVRLTHGRIGRAFRAIGQNEVAARSIGIPTHRYQIAAITLGCAIAGLGGSFIPHVFRFLSPETFTWHESLLILIMITVGGLGSLAGAVVGAAVLIVLPEYLRDFAQYKMLAYGVFLILALVFMPRGIAGVASSLAERFGRGGRP